MPEETKSYFVLIAEAIEELRKELKFMSSMHETPAKFGIKVRSHPECLAITAAAKMRSGTAQVVQVGYSSTKIETPYFENDKSLINQNTEAFISLLSELSTNCSIRNIHNSVMFEGVERGKIASLLRKLKIHKMNLPFADNVLANFINDTEEGKLTLKKDEIYVLGDNPKESIDSRMYGPLKINNIIGKIFLSF
jgi:hypothetical protein